MFGSWYTFLNVFIIIYFFFTNNALVYFMLFFFFEAFLSPFCPLFCTSFRLHNYLVIWLTFHDFFPFVFWVFYTCKGFHLLLAFIVVLALQNIVACCSVLKTKIINQMVDLHHCKCIYRSFYVSNSCSLFTVPFGALTFATLCKSIPVRFGSVTLLQ